MALEGLKRASLKALRRFAKGSGLSSVLGESRIAHRFRRGYYRRFPLPEEDPQRGPVSLKMQHPDDADSRYNVLLVQVPLPANQRHKRIIPLGLAYIASYLLERKPELNVGILDAQLQSLTYWRTLSKILEHKWDIVGIGYWTVQSQFAANLTKAIKAHCPETIVVHGGVHPTIWPEEALQVADYAVLHEGEETFHELVDALQNGGSVDSIKGIAYLRDGDIVKTEPRPFIADLDSLPFPAWHLLPIERYKMPLHVVGGERLPIVGSRGCPYECSFCCSPLIWKRKVRWRSARNVVDEMKAIIDQYGISYFHFWDDNMTLKPQYVDDLCRTIIDDKLDIKWIGLDRSDHLNRHPELLSLMKESGCVGIEVGVESANPDTLLHIQKNQAVDENYIALENQKKAGLYPLYTCMAFNPGESIVGYYLQKEFLDEAQRGYHWYEHFHPFTFPLYMGQFSTPYPGTELERLAPQLGVVLLDEPEELYHHRINFIPNSLLDDVPVRTINKLSTDHYYMYLLATWTGLYTVYDHRNNREELAQGLYDAWRFLNALFQRCSGRFTVRQLAIRMSEQLNLPMTKSLRMTAFTVYLFAQLGILRSALYHLDLDIEPKCYQIPGDKKWQIMDLLRDNGVTQRKMVGSFSVYRG